MDYANLIEESINEIESTMYEMIDIIGAVPFFKESVKEKIDSIRAIFYSCGYDPEKLMRFYQDKICFMRPNIVKIVANCLCGYYVFRCQSEAVDKTQSINELLHIIHQDVVNNDYFYNSFPIVYKDEEKKLNVYGTDSELIRNIVNAIINHNNIGKYPTIILSVNENKALIMAKGLGHAASFEIDRNADGIIRCDYLIPKICDVEMVNELPGINKIFPTEKLSTDGATGIIFSSEEQFGAKLLELFNGIPTDMDLYNVKDGGSNAI